MHKLMQLKNKKGFTLVELIVVLAMIGVLTAIILPLSLNAGKPQAAQAKAKSFYFGTQKILAEYRMEAPEKDTGYLSYVKGGLTFTINSGDYLYMYAKAEKGKGFTEVGLAKLDALEDGSAANTATGYQQYQYAAVINESSADHSWLDKLNTFSTDEDTGYYYALIDDQCRVIMTYWLEFVDIGYISKATDTSAEFSKTTITTTSDYAVDSNTLGAYPIRYGFDDATLFQEIKMYDDDDTSSSVPESP